MVGCSLPGLSVNGTFRQEYWSGLPFPSPGHLPGPVIEARSPSLQADRSFTEWATREAHSHWSLWRKSNNLEYISTMICILLLCVCYFLSHVRLFASPWTVPSQAPLSMGFSRQEHWNGLPFLSSEDLPNPGIKPWSHALQTDSLPFEL